MKTNKILKSLLGLCGIVAILFIISLFIPVSSLFAGTVIACKMGGSTLLAGLMPVGRAAMQQPGLGSGSFNPAALQAGPPMSSGGMGINAPYQLFEQIVFEADNTGGIAAGTWKMQSSDTLVECAIGASLGANVFTTPQLTTIAGQEPYAGGALTGLNAIRQYLYDVMIIVDYVNYDASDSLQLGNNFVRIIADPQGNYGNNTSPVVVYKSNAQYDPALIPIQKRMILNPNTAISVRVNAGSSAQLSFHVVDLCNVRRLLHD